VALQTDGKIVVVGSRNNDFAVARYETNGDLDPTFSGDGMQTTDLGASDRAYAVDIQADGMIVVAGISGADFGVVRYDPGGNPDNNFDTDGMVVTDFAGSTDTGYAVAIQKDGKIIVAGSSGSDIGLVRYNPNGTRDLGFGIDGKRIFGFSGYTTTVAKSVVVLKDDKIMVAGYAIFQPNPSDYIVDFAVARLNPDGSLDITFQGDGRLTTDFGSFDYASSLLVQHDLKFIVAGTSGNYLAVARYLPNGNLDHTFGTMGKANTYYNGGPASFNSYGYAAALQNDGKIVVVGTHHASIDNDFIVVRYDPPAFFLPLLMK
jgi:uncharacterized delta-60 repeat protein